MTIYKYMSVSKRSRGFTLLELLFVILILALLAMVGALSYQSARTRAENARRIADINSIGLAYESKFYPETGYSSLSPEQFSDNKIPANGKNESYNYVFGPDSYFPCYGTRVCASLDESANLCTNNSANCFCYTGTHTDINKCFESAGITSCPAGYKEIAKITGTVVHPSVAGQYPTRITQFVNPTTEYNGSSASINITKTEGHPELGCNPGINNDDLQQKPDCDNHQLNEGIRIRLNGSEIFHSPDKNETDPNFDDYHYAQTVPLTLTQSYSNRIEIDHDASGTGPGSVAIEASVCAQKI